MELVFSIKLVKFHLMTRPRLCNRVQLCKIIRYLPFNLINKKLVLCQDEVGLKSIPRGLLDTQKG